MNITDAIFDCKSGNAVISGYIKTSAPEENGAVLKEHAHLLFRYSEQEVEFQSVTGFNKIENGLYEVEKADLRVILKIPRFYEIIFSGNIENTKGKIKADGQTAGYVIFGNRNEQAVNYFELSQKLTETGLLFNIEGEMIPTNIDPSLAEAQLENQNFSVCGAIPWASMKVQGIRIADWDHKYIPWKPMNTVPIEITHNEKLSLTDLRLAASFQGALVPGRMTVLGSGHPYGPSVENMVSTYLGPNGLAIGDVQRAMLLENGFSAWWDCNYRVSCRGITLSFIEDLIRAKNPVSLSMSGDGLGGLETYVGLGERPSSRENWLPQDFDRLDFTAELDESGLRLSISGTLRGFTPEVLKRYEYKQPKQLARVQMRDGFSVQALLPWVLLLVRGSSLRPVLNSKREMT